MKIQDTLTTEDQHEFISWQQNRKRGKFAAGLVIIAFGTLFLLKEIGISIPSWAIGLPTILMAIGFVVLVRHKFRKMTGYVIIAIGVLLLFKSWYPDLINTRLIWPIVIIGLGFSFLFKNRSSRGSHRFKKDWKYKMKEYERFDHFEDVSKDDFIDAVSIFGGVQKNVVSKHFRGADIVTIFGGNEINLSQADFTDKVIMDVTTIFGGTTLIVPANWQIKSEMVAIFGGIEDKRSRIPQADDAVEKVVILKGACIFGGIEINSFS